jgi:hypothetical protein
LHNEELHNLYSSQNIINKTKFKEDERVGRVPRMEEMRSAHKMMVGNLKGRDHLTGVGVDGRIILKWISRK